MSEKLLVDADDDVEDDDDDVDNDDDVRKRQWSKSPNPWARLRQPLVNAPDHPLPNNRQLSLWKKIG